MHWTAPWHPTKSPGAASVLWPSIPALHVPVCAWVPKKQTPDEDGGAKVIYKVKLGDTSRTRGNSKVGDS